MARVIRYGVQSGMGFFVEWVEDSPKMDTDPVYAARMSEEECLRTILRMEEQGFDAHIFEIRMGKYDPGELIDG